MPLPGCSREVVGQPRQPLLGRLELDDAQPERRRGRACRAARAPRSRTAPSAWTPSCSATSVGDAGVGRRGGREDRDAATEARRAACAGGGSRGGSRGPSRRCSAPRRPRAGRSVAASRGSTSSRKPGLLSRSGLTSSTSTSPAWIWSWIGCHWSMLVELIVTARMPARSAAAIWLRISASSGLTITVGPAPRLAQQLGGHEVDRRLAPAGALDDERATAVDGERLDGGPLVLAEDGVVASDQRPQVALGGLAGASSRTSSVSGSASCPLSTNRHRRPLRRLPGRARALAAGDEPVDVDRRRAARPGGPRRRGQVGANEALRLDAAVGVGVLAAGARPGLTRSRTRPATPRGHGDGGAGQRGLTIGRVAVGVAGGLGVVALR